MTELSYILETVVRRSVIAVLVRGFHLDPTWSMDPPWSPQLWTGERLFISNLSNKLASRSEATSSVQDPLNPEKDIRLNEWSP
jgi:hypothetical protein